MKTRRRFRLRRLAWPLLAAVVFLSPEGSRRIPLDTFAEIPSVGARPAPAPGGAAPAPAAEAPDAIAGFIAVLSSRFVVRAEPDLGDQAERLAAEAERAFGALEQILGRAPGPAVEIRLVSNAREMARVAPPGRTPPSWATGITYADRDLILLSLLSPRSGRFVPLAAVLRHELAHLVVHRIVGERPIPRWFDEGIALWAAADDYAGRSEELLEAALRDRLIPLGRLERGYPADPRLVPLAYAQSLDVVSYVAEKYGRAAIPAILREVGDGRPFREAVLDTLGTTVDRLESDWRHGIRVWYRWIPALVSGTTLWGLISILLAWAYLRQRRRRKELYARWDREQEAAERQAVEASGAPAGDEAPPLDGLPKVPPAGQQAKGPVVFHDGRYHTLH